MATFELTSLASSAQYGAAINSLSPIQIATLIANYVGDYQNFIRLLTGDVNSIIQQVELQQPEGQRMVCDMTGWDGQAARVASAINGQFQAGKITYQGKSVAAWPEFPSQIAWASTDGNTVELRWRKEGPFLWIIIGVIVVALGFGVYELVRHMGWVLKRAAPKTPPGSGGGGNSGGGINGASIWAWVLTHIPEVALIGGGLAVTPFVLGRVVAIRKDYRQLED